jgi:ferritin-like metal-binding protein YciE
MRQYLVAATALFALTAVSSPSVALQVTLTSPRASFVQGEPIYIWVDYYNNTEKEIGLPSEFLIGFDVLTVRNRSGEVVRQPREQVKRMPPGGNRIKRIGAKEHFVFFTNLLDHVNLTDADSYDVQIVVPNRAPEQYLDQKHPVLPPSQLVRGPIESNRWQFTVTLGSGDAFDLVARPLREKTAGTFALCQSAEQIVEKYPNSAYAPYAVMCEVERLLIDNGQDPVPRFASAKALVEGLRSGQAAFEYLDIAVIRYAERLAKLGQNDAAIKLVKELRRQEHNDAARLYIGQFLRHQEETK